MKKGFTLIELIVVIAVLGILAAIILPNISGMKERSIRTAVVADTRTLQTVSDMYQIENNSALPTIAPPTEQLPQPVDFSKIYPDQLRNLPKTEGVKYWIDVNGTVWSSYEDMPQGFNYDSTTGNLTWSKVSGASGYEVQEIVKSNATSALGRSVVKYKPIQKILDVGTVTFKGETNKTYAISSIDKYGFVSAPISTTAGYESGYQDTLESVKKGQSGVTVPTTPTNPTPTNPTPTEPTTPAAPLVSYLNVVVTPQTLDNNSQVTTTVTSTDTTKLNIKSVEYRVDGGTATTTAPTGPFTVGTHTIDVRAQDQSGTWTDWVSKPITVTQAVPLVTYLNVVVTPQTLDNNSKVTTSVTSTDTTKLNIKSVEYRVDGGTATTTAPTGPFTVGTHTIDVRAQDQSGTWTDWVSKTITVSEALAVIPNTQFVGYYVEQPNTTTQPAPYVTMSAYSKDATSVVVYRFNPATNDYFRVNTTGANPSFSNGKVTYIATDLVYQGDTGTSSATYRFEFTQSDGSKKNVDYLVKTPYGGTKNAGYYSQNVVTRTTQSVATTTSTTAQLTLSNVPTGGNVVVDMVGKTKLVGGSYTNRVFSKTYSASASSDVISLTGLIPNTLHKLTYTYNAKNGVYFEETQYFVTKP